MIAQLLFFPAAGYVAAARKIPAYLIAVERQLRSRYESDLPAFVKRRKVPGRLVPAQYQHGKPAVSAAGHVSL
jgi:hypothetical protein